MKFGIFGVGRIGRVHANIILEQGHDVIALGDEAAPAIEYARKELNMLAEVPSYATPEEMIEGAKEELNGVIIASHTKDHTRHALPFVKAKIPVYLEKPLSDDLDQAFEFVQQVGPSKQLVQIGLQRRYDPALLYTKKLISDGLIGDIREIRCVLRDQFPPPPTYKCRGIIIDMGIHVADEAIFFTDEFPNEIWATVHTTLTSNPLKEGADTAFVTFTTPKGIVGRLDMSRTHSSGYNNETYIIGTQGTIHVGRFAGYPGPIHLELWKSDGTLHTSEKFDMPKLSGEYPEFLPRFDAAYRTAHKSFQDSIDSKSDFQVTQNHGLDAQVFVEAAHRSARLNGQHVVIEHNDDLTIYREACLKSGLVKQ